jgi:hypothetical protein
MTVEKFHHLLSRLPFPSSWCNRLITTNTRPKDILYVRPEVTRQSSFSWSYSGGSLRGSHFLARLNQTGSYELVSSVLRHSGE